MRFVPRGMLLLGFLCPIFACKKSPPPSPSNEVKTTSSRERTESQWNDWIKSSSKLDDSQKALLLSQVPQYMAQDKQEEKDRRELVTPPPAGWRPENVARKIKLTLVAEKVIIRRGEKFRYRLEIQNVGRDSVRLIEMPGSFIKNGLLGASQGLEFYVQSPGDEEKRLWLSSRPSQGLLQYKEYKFPESWSEAQKSAAVEKLNQELRAESELSLMLQPGETLRTRTDSGHPNGFRELGTDFEFNRPGTHVVKAVHADLTPKPPSEKSLEAGVKRGHARAAQLKDYARWKQRSLGRAESNTVELEVVE